MTVSIKIRLGPMAEITAHGDDCEDIAERLKGWQQLNDQVEKLSADLAERMYPEEEVTPEAEQSAPPEEAV